MEVVTFVSAVLIFLFILQHTSSRSAAAASFMPQLYLLLLIQVHYITTTTILLSAVLGSRAVNWLRIFAYCDCSLSMFVSILFVSPYLSFVLFRLPMCLC